MKYRTSALSSRKLLAVVCLPLVSFSCFSKLARAEDSPPFRGDVIMQAALGHVEAGNYALRATIIRMEPFAKIPPHIHPFGGVRYVLEGAITVNWKDGAAQTFSQGSTYFEGPGQNHPQGVIAASNPTDKVTRILLVEWVPSIRGTRFASSIPTSLQEGGQRKPESLSTLRR
jgi:quercetin dioxygenase-like cupin family protein